MAQVIQQQGLSENGSRKFIKLEKNPQVQPTTNNPGRKKKKFEQ